MKGTLDFEKAEFKTILDKSTALVLRQFEDVLTKKGYHYFEQQEVESWFDEAVPEEGMLVEDLFELVREKIMDTATGNLGANMYGYVMSGGNQIGIVADKLAATINQNVAKWHLSPSITEIDKRVIQWAAEMVGFGKNVGGFLGSSGSSANLDGLTVARNIYFEKLEIRKKGLFGMKPFVVYCSDETHNSIDKAVQFLGIGSDNLRRIATDEYFKINTKALVAQIEADITAGFQPFCIVGNAGTVNTGAIDDLETLALIAKKYNTWFHVDGAYGGLVAVLDTKKELYKGISSADSLALDFHKWLYQPFEVGCVLVKNWDYLKRSYFKKAEYLDKSLEAAGRLEFNEHHFLLSRNAKSLKVWMTMKTFGMKRIRAMIQKDIDLTDYLDTKIKSTTDFKLIASSDLAISCFQYTGNLKDESAIRSLNRQLIPALEKDGRIFITGTTLKGEFVLRACFINHRKNEATTDYLLEVIRSVGQTLL